MEKDKNPHIPAWKAWVLLITTVLAINTVQNYWVHSRMWEEIHRSQSTVNQVLQADVEYHQNMNFALELILRKLQEP